MVMDSNWAFPKSLCILLLVFPYGVHGKKGPCCSQDNKKCTSWMKQYDANDCASHNDKNVWFPDGDKDQKSSCANLWSNKDCSEHEDCCGMQVCDAKPWDLEKKKCQHPLDMCRDFGNKDMCESRAGCKIEDGSCVPNYDYHVYNPAALPPMTVEDPACCSMDHKKCEDWLQQAQSHEECSEHKDSNGKFVWFPEGEPEQGGCGTMWSSKKCDVHEDCCGTLVCDAMSWNFREKTCNHPKDLCSSYDEEELCNSRTSCEYKEGSCVPSFDYTIFDPHNLPEEAAMETGCCSQKHLKCDADWSGAFSHSACKNYKDGKYLWLPDGESHDPNEDSCNERWDGGECSKHSDCCGSMVCASAPWNPIQLSCQHPLDACSGYPEANFCNLQPACQWDNGSSSCTPVFDYSILDPPAKAALEDPPEVQTADENPDFLGLCEGFVGKVSGDPHVTTFDRKSHDCQATGTFVLAKADDMFEVQGIFDKRRSEWATMLHGVAVSYPAVPSVPDVQVNFAEYDSGEASSIAISDDCTAHLYLDGELKEAERGSAFSGDGYAVIVNSWGAVDVQLFDGDIPSAAVRIIGYGKPSETNGCMMTAKVCMPSSKPDMLEVTKGLLGTPDGNKTNEWVDPGTGEILPLEQYGEKAYSFCTTQYCVEYENESLFVYEEVSHEDRYSCSTPFPGEPDLTDLPEGIAEICGQDRDCALEGILGGAEAARRIVEEETKMVRTVNTPELLSENAFVIPEEESPVSICPEDLVLAGTQGSTPFSDPPVVITARSNDAFTLKLDGVAVGSTETVYVEYQDGTSSHYECTSDRPEIEEGIVVSCPAGVHSTLVHVVFSDPSLDAGADNASILPCCDGGEDTNPKVKYTFMVPCDTLCPEDARRKLRGVKHFTKTLN